ncbi:hypothetical protein QYM36_004993 [Artemia franciscana]|uniref:HAT C-terminal dimerisation domain-containing protein n=1 Tax=Artemia franciscana TaxID=6661 RepID=A0AA88I0J9_ARTSF|nr:hypothetical protein QYM36_004993 [Artemia franciscana]
MEEECRKLVEVNWESLCGEEVTGSLESFWVLVLNFEDSLGRKPYLNIATAALSMTLAAKQRLCRTDFFSVMNMAKTKLRNRMQTEILNSILIVRCWLNNQNICCKNADLCTPTTTRFTSKMYEYSESTAEA